MDDIIYNLLLTSRFGFSVPGTLRYRFTDLDAVAATGDVKAVLAEIEQGVRVQVAVFQLAGTLSVPLLGLRSVPLAGVALGTAAGPIATELSSTDATRPLRLLFNLLDLQHIGGGLVWRAGQLGQQVFSVLGTQRPFGLHDMEA